MSRETSPDHLSRRDFLRLTGKAVVGALGCLYFGSPLEPNPINSRARPHFKGESELPPTLEAFGLGDFSEVYALGTSIKEKFGDFPYAFYGILDVCQDVVSDEFGGQITEKNHPRVVELRDGWGNKQQESYGNAIERINRMKITISESLPDTEDQVREFLKKAAVYFAPFVLAMPEEVAVVKLGGYAGYQTAITAPSQTEAAPVVFLHEVGGHLAEFFWREIKPYVSLENFLSYVKSYFSHIDRMATFFMDLPLEEALQVKNGNPLIFCYGLDESYKEKEKLRSLKDKLKALGAEFSLAVVTDDCTPEQVAKEWNSLVHEVFWQHRFLSGDQQKAFFDQHDRALYELYFSGISSGLRGSRSVIHFDGLITEVAHILVGPLQKKFGGLPSSTDETWGDVLTSHVAGVQEARLSAYSTLPPGFQPSDIRAAFGLSKSGYEIPEVKVIIAVPAGVEVITSVPVDTEAPTTTPTATPTQTATETPTPTATASRTLTTRPPRPQPTEISRPTRTPGITPIPPAQPGKREVSPTITPCSQVLPTPRPTEVSQPGDTEKVDPNVLLGGAAVAAVLAAAGLYLAGNQEQEKKRRKF